jgi:hypothetical protein
MIASSVSTMELLLGNYVCKDGDTFKGRGFTYIVSESPYAYQGGGFARYVKIDDNGLVTTNFYSQCDGSGDQIL